MGNEDYYPAGAYYDKSAPYNQDEERPIQTDGYYTELLGKQCNDIETLDYEVDDYGDIEKINVNLSDYKDIHLDLMEIIASAKKAFIALSEIYKDKAENATTETDRNNYKLTACVYNHLSEECDGWEQLDQEFNR